MLRLETDRLLLVPLNMENFRLFLEDYRKMEENLCVTFSGNELPPELQVVFRKPYEQALEDVDNFLWYTIWQIILQERNLIIGSLAFKGCANERGEVEIGYGTAEPFQNMGYMTESLIRLLEWALAQQGVSSVLAETDKENIASQKVLEKAGMIKYSEEGDYFWYRTAN